MELLHSAEEIFHVLLEVGIILLELAGFIVLMVTAARCFWTWLHHGKKVPLKLAHGIALALEFKLGGEVLHTVIASGKEELIALAATIVMRVALTLLVHWEIKTEEAHMKVEEKKTADNKQA